MMAVATEGGQVISYSPRFSLNSSILSIRHPLDCLFYPSITLLSSRLLILSSPLVLDPNYSVLVNPAGKNSTNSGSSGSILGGGKSNHNDTDHTDTRSVLLT